MALTARSLTITKQTGKPCRAGWRASIFPATDLPLVLIGLPLLATIVGWVFAGRQPSAVARQPPE
jgi:hypothetical protein